MHALFAFDSSKVSAIIQCRKQNPKSDTKDLENHAFSLLQSCSSFKQMTQIQAQIIKNSIDQNNFVISKLVSYCFSSKHPSYAKKVFDQMHQPNTVLWNNMIKAFTHVGLHYNSLFLYRQMLLFGSTPNNFTFNFALSACSEIPALQEGKTIHGQVLKQCFNKDIYIQTSLLDLYGYCHDIMYAKQVFERMLERDIVVWNAIISSNIHCGLIENARKLFDEMPVRNVSTWTAMIGALAHSGNPREALEFFFRMQDDGVRGDKKTIVSVLSAVSDLGTLDVGKWIHDYVMKNGIPVDDFLGTALIDMYSKCGSIGDAKLVFNEIHSKSISCYNAMIYGFAVHGLGEDAIRVFRDAEKSGENIDDLTFLSILTACCHCGLIQEGRRYFNFMRQKYGIEPKIEHYGCMADLLGRAGLLDEAMEMIQHIEPDPMLLTSLASSCRIHGNAELGEKLVKKMYSVDPNNSGFLVLKSNLFASDGRWKEVAGVRRIMKEQGIKKNPGCSWIEVNNVIHEFVAGDDSHPQSKEIYSKLEELRLQMKMYEDS